jgi:uncharacterized RDD family membrane protein YckC
MSATTAPAAITAQKAGWLTRALAILIDSLGVLIVSAAISGLASGDASNARNEGLFTLLFAAYCTYFWSSAGKGQTLGCKALNIRVVKTDGSYLDYAMAFVRYIGFVISAAAFLLGFIWAIFDAQKQGWHDKLAGTYVVVA